MIQITLKSLSSTYEIDANSLSYDYGMNTVTVRIFFSLLEDVFSNLKNDTFSITRHWDNGDIRWVIENIKLVYTDKIWSGNGSPYKMQLVFEIPKDKFEMKHYEPTKKPELTFNEMCILRSYQMGYASKEKVLSKCPPDSPLRCYILDD